MGRLIIIIERSAEGKRYIKDYLFSKSVLDTIFIKKYVTRYSRPREFEMNNDFLFDAYVEIKNCEYTYSYRDNYYGIKKDDIDAALVNNRNPVIFLTNIELIEKLKRDYPHTLTVYILDMIYGKGLETDCDLKYEAQEKVFLDSVKYTKKKLYDYCIINVFDESFVQQLGFIFEHELSEKSLNDGVTVFLSYNWNDKEKVDEVDNYLSQKVNITVVRDVRNIGSWGSIREFMKSIREQGYAVLFISDMYLKSPNCMYEILELMKEKDYEKRIFPVVLNNSIYSPFVRLEYIQYWQNRYNELEKLTNSIQITNLGQILDELKRYKLILNSIDDFLGIVIDMNNPQFENIGEKIYKEILK